MENNGHDPRWRPGVPPAPPPPQTLPAGSFQIKRRTGVRLWWKIITYSIPGLYKLYRGQGVGRLRSIWIAVKVNVLLEWVSWKRGRG